ncbi:MAG: hypothetical protein Q9218_006631 [Villophora microphyllina]
MKEKGRSEAVLARPTEPSGLGTLSALPSELLSMIWHYLVPGPSSTIEQLDARTEFCNFLDLHKRSGSLSVLRTSKPLYYEVIAEIYRNRTLAIYLTGFAHDLPFDKACHNLIQQILRHPRRHPRRHLRPL